jgi:DNA-binding SARP family transcriptional activator/WD40 repeat protein
MMEFHVLGSIEVRDGGRSVALGGPQQRRLLAVLLADLGQVVPVDRLVEAVWSSDAAPDGALRTTRTYVSRLRAALGDGYVLTREPGYLLDLDGAEVDKCVFEELVERARRAAPSDAISLYDEALGRWHGPAFAEFAEEWWARPEAVRLDELRLIASEERVDAMLALGRAHEVVPDLEQHTAAHPYRERFTAQLMTALQQCGREVDAHRAYQKFRTVLGEDTGLEPSAELAELDRAIAAGTRPVASGERRLRGYVVGELLGQGAFGAVYRATQPGLGREVALKQINPQLADDDTFVHRFEAEAQLVSRLEHPHIVPLYDYWREPGGAYLVFRLLRGGNAEESLLGDGPWAIDRVDRLVNEVGSALVAAHAAGVVHRDVKPANILFDEMANAYLADFGIARVAGDANAERWGSEGSPLYASPEQIRDGQATARSDQYSLALTAWELLAGGAPFSGSDLTAVQAVKLRSGLPSVRTSRPELPVAVDAVLTTAGSSRPDDRFASVAEMLVAWRAAFSGQERARSTGDMAPQAPNGVAASKTLTDVVLAAANPYKGLRPFAEADSIDFFGRGALVDQLAAAVALSRFVTVVGPSGAGKSSLVHAGLVPRLRAADRVLVVTTVPGAHPFDELSAALSRIATSTLDIDPARLATNGGVHRAVRNIASAGGEVVLVVDQFEELWTVSDRDERQRFVTGLALAVNEPDSCLRVVATVRADFFDRPLDDTAVGPLVAAGTFGVTPLTPAELLDAVTQPAARVGVTFEDGLAAELVADVAAQPSSLPLLQFALTELYEQRDGTKVTAHSYRALGGVAGAVAQRADELYDSLADDDRAAARELFTRLVAIGEGTGDTRRRVRVSELAHVPAAVTALFARHRLIAFDRDPTSREPTVEVAHEALLTRWPRLHSWIDEDRDWLRLRRHLHAAAEAWEAAGREPGELYRGARLAAALEAVDHHPGAFTDSEAALLEASRVSRDRELEHQRHEARRLRRLLAGVACALVVALVAGTVAVIQQRSARASSRRAQASSYRAETGRLLATARSLDTGDTPVAALLALEAGRRRDVERSELAGTLQQVLTAKPGFLGSFPTVGEYAFGADGTTFIARTGNGVEAYNLADRSRTAQVDHPAARGMPGRRLAAGDGGLVVETGGDREVRRYLLPALSAAGPAIVTPGSVNALDMSHDGTLVTGHPGGLVVVWDAASGSERRRFRVDGDVKRLSLSSDASTVAVLTASGAQAWAVATGMPAGPPFAGGDDIAVSPSGHRAAVIGFSAPAQAVYDTTTGMQTATLQYNGNAVRFLDEDRVVDSGAAVVVLDATTGTTITSTTTTCGCDIAISPDGRTVATGLDAPGLYALDGRELLADALDAPRMSAAFGISVTATSADARLLSVTAAGAGTTVYERAGRGWRIIRTTPGLVGSIQADGRLLAIDGTTGTASILDAETGAIAQSFPGPRGDVFPLYVSLSGDGRFLATGSFEGLVTVTDTRTGAEVARLTDLQDANAGNQFPFASLVPAPQFSKDGRHLVGAAWSGAAVAWDTTTWKKEAVLEPAIADVNGSTTPAFDPSGRYLAVSRGRTSVDLFDAGTLQPVRHIPLGVQGVPFQARFDPSGDRILVVLDTQQALTYDVRTGQRVGTPLAADYSSGMIFTDAATLVTPVPGRDVLRLWHLDLDRLQDEGCRAAGRNLTRDEWQRLGPTGEAYHLTCPQFGEPPSDPTLSVEQPPARLEVPSA